MLRVTILLSFTFLAVQCAVIDHGQEAGCKVIDSDTLQCSHINEEQFIKAVQDHKDITKINLWHSEISMLPLQKVLNTGLNKRLIQLSFLHNLATITFDENTFKDYNEIKTLEFTNCKVHEIKKEYLSPLTKLYRVEWINSTSDVAHLDAFSLVSPRILSISQSPLHQMKSSLLEQFPNLRMLNLDENQLTKFADHTFDKNRELRVIHLNNNKIKTIQKDLFDNLENLYLLDLSNNPMQSCDLMDILKEKNNLHNLYIHGWPCSTLEDILTDLKKSYTIECTSRGEQVINGSNCTTVILKIDEYTNVRLYREERTFTSYSNSNVYDIPCVAEKQD